MTAKKPRTELAYALDEQSSIGTPLQIMWAHALQRDMRYTADGSRDSDATGEEIIKALFANVPVLASHAGDHRREQIFDLKAEKMLVSLRWYSQTAEVGWSVIGTDEAQVESMAAEIDRLAPEISHVEENIVPIQYWALNPQGGPSSFTRKIEINPWEVIEGNYPTAIRPHLQSLIDLTEPASGGKLILWHGPPGNGKTFFLRALAYAWRDWCNVSYVVDPEDMFDRAYYMIHTVLSGEGNNRWHLLVLEDTGEFMLNDARHQTGQGLSRLLNLTDGLVGQGLKLLVLMTTNEKISELHPAVKRPGRCLAEIAFPNFTHAEAQEWARQHRVTLTGSDTELTLADLYERTAPAHITNPRQSVSTGQYV